MDSMHQFGLNVYPLVLRYVLAADEQPRSLLEAINQELARITAAAPWAHDFGSTFVRSVSDKRLKVRDGSARAAYRLLQVQHIAIEPYVVMAPSALLTFLRLVAFLMTTSAIYCICCEC